MLPTALTSCPTKPITPDLTSCPAELAFPYYGPSPTSMIPCMLSPVSIYSMPVVPTPTLICPTSLSLLPQNLIPKPQITTSFEKVI